MLRTIFPRKWIFATLLVAGFLLIFFSLTKQSGAAADHGVAAKPPVAPVRMITDEYFGVKVSDPYRYMENLNDPEVAGWFKAQSAYTTSELDAIPGRAKLLARIKELDEGAPASVSDLRWLPGDVYFYQKRLATEEVAKLYTRVGLGGEEKLVIDPTKFAVGGAHQSISYYAVSFDGASVAAGISAAGSEDGVIHIIDVRSGKESGETIDRGRFGSPSWMPDGHSFVYNRLQKMAPGAPGTDTELNSRMYLHVVGTNPDADQMVLGVGTKGVDIAPADLPFVQTAPGVDYAIGMDLHGVAREMTLYIAPIASLASGNTPWKKICDVGDDVTSYDVHGDDLYLVSHKGAPHFQVLHTKLSNPDVAHAEVVVKESQVVITSVGAASDAVYVQELDGGLGRLVRVPYASGKPEEVSLPVEGAVRLSATDPRVPGALLALGTWTKAEQIYAYDPASGRTTDTKLQPLGPYDDPKDVESVEVKAKSYDGTMVPLSIIYKKGIKLDGSHPTILSAYGAYGITLDPYFDPVRLAWFERGGVYAIAHVRGGGEYGEDWHLAGKKLTKPNTWKDTIACAQYLIDEKYTSVSHLGVRGGSAGGITVGRAITERPDLFAVAFDMVPMSDAVRSEFTPNGPPNIPEFGTVTEPDGFKALYGMSAYHHIKDGTAYPAVMVTTGWNDPRVASWQAGKMAARLQAATSSGKPVLLRVDYDAGHGMGSTKTQDQEMVADQLSFALWQFGEAGFQPPPTH